MPDALRPVFEKADNRIAERKDDDSYEVSVPTVHLVDTKSAVRNLHVDPDYHKRLETTTALEWVDAL
jgi:hypothetical protein